MDFDQLFPDEREKGETPLRQCQLVMLRMLKIFDHLCTKHNIQYFLTAGTLLGAIRHQGFIPWDDDLDIGITRENYEKFVKYAVPELPRDIFFQTSETDPWYPSARVVEAKLRDKYSSYPEAITKDPTKKSFHTGIMLDINVYYRSYLPHNLCMYAVNRSLEMMFWKVGPNNTNDRKRANVLKWISKYAPLPLVYGHSFIKTLKLAKKVGHCHYTQKEIAGIKRTKFEDMEACIPIGWHSYLPRVYGDYMKPPPVGARLGHHDMRWPDPFTPCDHAEILHWKDRKAALKNQVPVGTKQ